MIMLPFVFIWCECFLRFEMSPKAILISLSPCLYLSIAVFCSLICDRLLPLSTKKERVISVPQWLGMFCLLNLAIIGITLAATLKGFIQIKEFIDLILSVSTWSAYVCGILAVCLAVCLSDNGVRNHGHHPRQFTN